MTDGEPDAGADTEPEAGADTEPEAGADTEPEAGAEADAEAGTDSDVQPDLALDTDLLEEYLAGELGVDVVGTAVVHDGVNLSLLVDTESQDAAYVVQSPNQLRDLATFNDLPVEYGVLERLRSTRVPAPEPVLVCQGPAVLGPPFIVMSHLEGESVPFSSRLPERFRTPAAREQYAHALVDTLADLHTVEVDPFLEVCDRRPVGRHVDRILGQFEAAIAASGLEPTGFRRVADWLQSTVPEPDRTALVHGDYRPGNVLVTGTDDPQLSGVLDWETAFVGDPLTELGYLLLRWRDAGDHTPAIEPIVARYGESPAIDQLRERNEGGLAPFTAEPGSPTRRELAARYEAGTGLSFEHDRFYRAFAAVTLAAVWAMLHRRRSDAGGSSSVEPHLDYLLALATLVLEGDLAL